MHGTTTTPIVITKFHRSKHEVEVTNKELKQERAMGEVALRREQAAKQRAKEPRLHAGFLKRKQRSSR